MRWFDLYEAIKAGGHRLMVSIADLGWGSVIGNTLDHGVTYLPHRRGHGGAVRHGGGAPRRRADAHRHGRDGGQPRLARVQARPRPEPDQMFMQSNYGIVTKMGVWLNPYPECYMPLWLRVWNEDDLPAVVDTLRVLMLDGTIRMVPQIMNAMLARLGVLEPRPVVAGGRADPRRRDRPDGPRARGGPLADALRAVRGTRTWRTSSSRRSRRRSSASPAPTCGARRSRRRTSPSSSTRPSSSRAACRTSAGTR